MDQFIVRLPDGMRDRIKVAAEANNRSMNAEIVAALEEKYPAPKPESRLISRLHHLIDIFDDTVMSDKLSNERREHMLSLFKDSIVDVIDRMTEDELARVRAETSFPGELDDFKDWPPQRLREISGRS